MDKSYCPHWELTGVLGFQERPELIIAFVNDEGVIKINDMVIGPRVMMCNSRAFGRSFDVPFVFFFPA